MEELSTTASGQLPSAKVKRAAEPPFTVKIKAVSGKADKGEATQCADHSASAIPVMNEFRVPEEFSNIQLPSKSESSDSGARIQGAPVSSSPPAQERLLQDVMLVDEDIAEDEFVEDAAPWDDPETGYQLLTYANLEGTSIAALGFQNSLQVAQGSAPSPLTWPLGQVHLARTTNYSSSVLAPARAPPSLRDRRPCSAPALRPPQPQSTLLGAEIRGIVRATPTNRLLSPREAQLLDEEPAARFAQKAHLAGTGSAFPKAYLASLPVMQESEKVAEGNSAHLSLRSKRARKEHPPCQLHVNGVQMGHASNAGTLMVTSASMMSAASSAAPQRQLALESGSVESLTEVPQSSNVFHHIPSCSKATASTTECGRQRPMSAHGLRRSDATDSTAHFQQKRPASAKVHQVAVFAESLTAEPKRARPVSAMASYQTGQASNAALDESCSHQLRDATLELSGFQASGGFGAFPPRSRPQSRPHSAQSAHSGLSGSQAVTQRSSSQVEIKTQAIRALQTPFGFGSFPVKATERYCRRGRREPGKVDRTAARSPAAKRPSSAPASRSYCESKAIRTSCRKLISTTQN